MLQEKILMIQLIGCYSRTSCQVLTIPESSSYRKILDNQWLKLSPQMRLTHRVVSRKETFFFNGNYLLMYTLYLKLSIKTQIKCAVIFVLVKNCTQNSISFEFSELDLNQVKLILYGYGVYHCGYL